MRIAVEPTLTTMGSRALEVARREGARECAVSISRSTGNRVVHRDGHWDEIKGATTFAIKVRLFVDDRYAVHVTSDGRPASLEKFIKDAVSLTRYLAADKHRHLPDPTLFRGRSTKDLGLYDPAVLALDLAARKTIAEKTFTSAKDAAGPKLISCSATFGDHRTESLLLTSNGFSDSEVTTSFYSYASLSLKDTGESRPSEYEYSAARTLKGLKPAEEVGKLAALRTLARLGARKIPSGKLDVVVENRALGRLLGGFLSPLTGSNIYNKQSCMAALEGRAVTSPLFSLTSEPLLDGGLGSGRYDAEGITARRLPVIDKGALKNFFIDVYYGSKLARKPTSSDTFNLVVTPGNTTLEGLIGGVKRGLLITAFNGGNSNATSGDFSHGVSGFLVERGALTTPVKELNIAGNHKDFWKKIRAVGNDPYQPSSRRLPSVLFTDIMIAGT